MAKDSFVAPMEAASTARILEKKGGVSKRGDEKTKNNYNDDAKAAAIMTLEIPARCGSPDRTDSVDSSVIETTSTDVDTPSPNSSSLVPDVLPTSKPASANATASTEEQPHKKPDPPSCDPWNSFPPHLQVENQYIRHHHIHLRHGDDQNAAVAMGGSDFFPDNVMAGANNSVRTAEDLFNISTATKNQSSYLQPASSFASMASSYVTTANNSLPNHDDSGKRKIKLRVLEQQKTSESGIDHGVLSVSWFKGTSTLELHEHVRRSLLRKIGFAVPTNINLVDLQVLDTSEDPPEEIVLSPHIPSGCEFLLQFCIQESDNQSVVPMKTRAAGTMSSTTTTRTPTPTPTPSHHQFSYQTKEMDSISDNLNVLNPQQLALLNQLNLSLPTQVTESTRKTTHHDSIEEQLKEITNLLLGTGGYGSKAKLRRQSDGKTQRHYEDDQSSSREFGKEERGKVVFGLAQYLLLFLSLIAISIEIQKFAPELIEWLEKQTALVKDCAANQETLFHCVSEGDFAGLVASVGLWLSQSVVTRHIFLFGFASSQKLWTVVYESAVTGTCWGVSYLFIRRGLNPDSGIDFMTKYWKDAMYGSLAGFFAGFLKQVLKNLIPDGVIQEAIRERTRMITWFSPFQ